MKKLMLRTLVCLAALWAGLAMAQGTNAELSGTVVDPSGTSVENVALTLENARTGTKLVSSSNEAGVYKFPAAQPGVYRLTAERSGFQAADYNNLILEVSAQVQVNLTLKIGNIQERVDVTVDPNSPLTAITPSVGGVIDGIRVSDLPLPDRNVLDLVNTEAGVTRAESAAGSNLNAAGARRLAWNVSADGISLMHQVDNNGVNSRIYLSPDLVDEIRVVTSPADAELGRGSGQVQISTRAGTSEFHGSLFESHRNTALNANTFFNNQLGLPRDLLIRNQFGGRVGGPIVRNKTFFHFLYDAQREVTKGTTTPLVYTSTARQGIFRFFPGALNQNYNAAVPTVDISGNPIKPAAATGDLQSISVFNRDPSRPVIDQTGTVQRLMGLIPEPNNFRVGDGLNTAGYTWSRRETSDRDQFNTRIDHHFNDRHQLHFSWTHQKSSALNGFASQVFPETPGGSAEQSANFFSFRATSTLSSRFVNELYAGAMHDLSRNYAAFEREGMAVLPKADGIGYLPNFTGGLGTVFPAGAIPSGTGSNLNVLGDNLSGISGRHTFKFGGEVRFSSAPDAFVDIGVTPVAMFGAGTVPVTGLGVAGIGGNQTTAQNLLINLSGSVNQVNQRFYATGGPDYEAIKEGQHAAGDIFRREFSLFFKDDWKVRPDLTLNLGVRYEYYGVPWLQDTGTGRGTTPGVIGGSGGLYGISGTSFADLYRPGHLGGAPTTIEYVGPNSPNPQRQLYNDDWNNFAPAVGLSWSIPYFGAAKTILRAGYGVGYENLPLFIIGNTAGLTPGTVAPTTATQYLDLSRIRLPLSPVGRPLDPVKLTDRNQIIAVHDTNLRTGYVQNWNLSIQRELPGRMSFDIRYTGSKGTKLVRQIDLNEANIFESGVLEAFLITQAGGDAPLLDKIFNGLNLGPGVVNSVVNGATVTGSMSVRNNANTRNFFANNNVGQFADYLNTTNNFTNIRGELLRRAGLPENQIVGNPQFANLMNPQGGSARIAGNFSNSTYHALQIELNKRFSNGWTLQSNYTWSRAIGEHAGNSGALIDNLFYKDGRNRHLDKRLLPFHRTHVFKTNGTFELPIGPNKRFLNSNSGLLSRLTERWQLGGILNLVSGRPITFASLTSTFNQYTSNNTANLIGPLTKGFGQVTFDDVGVQYFQGLTIKQDPAVASLTEQQGLRSLSTLQGIVDSGGRFVAINPAPGKLGNMGDGYLAGPGQVRLDVNVVKRIRIGESKEFEFRADAIDVMNRPIFGLPDTDINSAGFGRINATLGGNRIIVLNARINF